MSELKDQLKGLADDKEDSFLHHPSRLYSNLYYHSKLIRMFIDVLTILNY